MQQMIYIFDEEASAFGQESSEIKTEVMIIGYTVPLSNDPPTNQPSFYIRAKDGVLKRLKLCSQFKYLGSYISSSASLDQEIQIRKQRMQSASFDRAEDCFVKIG